MINSFLPISPIPISNPSFRAINRSSKLPLHYQLYDLLHGMIMRGDWKVGEMIPTESGLILEYKVSRSTIRQVLDRLSNEGLIQRKQGKGTFVNASPLEQGTSRIISFTEDMIRRGMVPATKVLFSGLVQCPEDAAGFLKIQPGTIVARLERLRLANEEPMCIEEAFFNRNLVPEILNHDYATIPLRTVLEKVYGIQIIRAQQTIRATLASSIHAKTMGVPHRSAVLFVERVSYTESNAPVEFLRLFFRGDRYSLQNELKV
ncbi:MAG: GntR family transcriptional regulator [Leptolinea sp.]